MTEATKQEVIKMKTFQVSFHYEERAVITVTSGSREEAKKSVESWLLQDVRVELPSNTESDFYKMTESLDTEYTGYHVCTVEEVDNVSTENN